jgi:hypothetical protein
VTDPAPPPDPRTGPPADQAADVLPRARRRATPVVRWIRGLSQGAYAAVLVAVVVALLLLAVIANPGDRVGPVRPADPPVGGPGLPATRL